LVPNQAIEEGLAEITLLRAPAHRAGIDAQRQAGVGVATLLHHGRGRAAERERQRGVGAPCSAVLLRVSERDQQGSLSMACRLPNPRRTLEGQLV
jgi:hypothetical protein